MSEVPLQRHRQGFIQVFLAESGNENHYTIRKTYYTMCSSLTLLNAPKLNRGWELDVGFIHMALQVGSGQQSGGAGTGTLNRNPSNRNPKP